MSSFYVEYVRMKRTKCFVFFILFSGFLILGATWYFELTQSDHQVSLKHRLPGVPNRLRKYCNVPSGDKSGWQEGHLNHNHELVGVITMFRHGDRGPLAVIINDTKPINCSSYVSDRYRVLENVVKKVDKKKKLAHSILPQSDFCKPGILTKQGSSQLIDLGYNFRDSYEKYFSFINPDNIKNIESYTTPFSRTIQSLSSFLFGLIGSKLFLNVSVFNQADVPFCFSYCRCEGASHYEKQHRKELKSHFDETNRTGKFPLELKALQKDIFNWSNKYVLPSTIKDVILSYACHRRTPPCNSNNVCLSSNYGTTLDHLLKYEAIVSANSLNLRKASILRSYGLFRIIDDRINSWIHQFKNRHANNDLNFPKLLLFSGHDLTLMYVLSTLSLYDGFLPKYASRLVIEVYTDKVHFFSRVLWNGEDVTKDIPPCFSRNRKHQRCSARFLSQYLKNQLQVFFKANNFEEACSNSQ